MSKKWIILLVIIALLVGVRITLPFVIKDQINKVLSDLNGYQGKVMDVDLALIRGAYVVDSLIIEKTSGNIKKPFLNVPRIDLSIEWGALFNGALVGEAVVESPRLNLVTGKNEEQSQYGKDVHWVDQFKKLIPLRINRFEIKDGHLSYHDPTADPELNFEMGDVQFVASNLSNVQNPNDTLPSVLRGSGTTLGGKLELNGGINALKKIPDLDVDLSFEAIDLTQLNEFAESYGSFDFSSGTLNFYFEVAMYNSHYQGYAKPLFDNVKITGGGGDKGSGFLNNVWEGAVSVVFEAFENQSADQTGTQIPFHGNLNDTDVGLWSTIKYLFSNAFIEALRMELDGDVNLKELTDQAEKNYADSEKDKTTE